MSEHIEFGEFEDPGNLEVMRQKLKNYILPREEDRPPKGCIEVRNITNKGELLLSFRTSNPNLLYAIGAQLIRMSTALKQHLDPELLRKENRKWFT